MGFNVTCTPGKDAGAWSVEVSMGAPALLLFLDPGNVVVQVPVDPGGKKVLARLCRELSREAAKLAVVLDPEGVGFDCLEPGLEVSGDGCV